MSPLSRSVLIAAVLMTTGPALGADPPAIVPWPRQMTVADGRLPLMAESRIVTREKSLVPLARLLADEIALATGQRLGVAEADARAGDIRLALDPALKNEAYRLVIAERADVAGADYAAIAAGTVTLLQALKVEGKTVSAPHMTVEDGPKLAYRGAMLDVARKPYSIDTLKECVRVCRYYKIRYLQLHLTDENAWVFPSTAYPKLGADNFVWAGGEKPTVYKLDELKALVAYAETRGVILVPEIEMPGHSGHLRGTLVDIFGYKDAMGKRVGLGVINMVSDEAYAALDILMGEVAAAFYTSPFIHIGCDEASPAGIETMPEVIAFIAKHQLKSADEVFNVFVNRMHAIVKKHGKRTIVWEGAPLEPTAPPTDLIVMPWVGGSTYATYAVGKGYSVINAPWGTKTAYFDPFLINGAQLKTGEPLLFGASSILWQAPSEAAVPYLRHTGALRNEPTWNPAAARGHADFLIRHRATEARLDRLLTGLTFRAAGTHDPLVFMRPDPTFAGETTLTLESGVDPKLVRYTLDGSEPTERSPVYGSPIRLTDSTTVKARAFGTTGETLSTFDLTYRKVPAVPHDAVGAKVTIEPELPGYPGPGPKGLTDGLLSDGDHPSSAGWVGWVRDGQPVHVTLDLGVAKRITHLSAHFLRSDGGIFYPEKVEFAVSDDSKMFRKIAEVSGKDGGLARGWFRADVTAVTARHVRLTAMAGGDWSFLDEVAVNAKPDGPTFKHAAQGKPVTLKHPPNEVYNLCGVAALTDGYVARSSEFLSPHWVGIEGKNFEATIDLEKSIEIKEVGARFLQSAVAGIYIPRTVEVFVSDDGKDFRKVGTITTTPETKSAFIQTLVTQPQPVKARYVRIVAYTNGSWIFADEVFVNR